MNRDQLMFLGYAVLSAGLTLAGSHGWVSKDDVDALGGALLAFATAYHIPNAKAAAALQQAKPANADTTDAPQKDVTAENFAVNPRGDTA